MWIKFGTVESGGVGLHVGKVTELQTNNTVFKIKGRPESAAIHEPLNNFEIVFFYFKEAMPWQIALLTISVLFYEPKFSFFSSFCRPISRLS